jgi:hypothetical protein
MITKIKDRNIQRIIDVCIAVVGSSEKPGCRYQKNYSVRKTVLTSLPLNPCRFFCFLITLFMMIIVFRVFPCFATDNQRAPVSPEKEVSIESIDETLRSLDNMSQQETQRRQLTEKLGETPENESIQGTLESEILGMSIRRLTLVIRAMGIEMKRYEIENRTAAGRISISKDQESFVRSNLHHDREDMNHQLDVIQHKETKIQKDINRLIIKLKSVEQQLIKVRQNQNKATLEKDRSFAQAVGNGGMEKNPVHKDTYR